MHDEEEAHEHMQGHDAAVKSVAPLHEMVKGYLIAAAEQMPEGILRLPAHRRGPDFRPDRGPCGQRRLLVLRHGLR